MPSGFNTAGRRFNEKETNPNPGILFITPDRTRSQWQHAEKILKAVAAQCCTLMKANGIEVKSLEEVPYNTEFAGRNWNAGEVVELVLRKKDGITFFPFEWVLGVMCHELAHCHHMNHGPSFQALNTKLKGITKEMRKNGNYGQGFWSAGTSLADGSSIGGDGLVLQSEEPAYLCGGAKKRSKGSARTTRGKTQPLVNGEASNSSGRQTERKRKAGRMNEKGFQDLDGEGIRVSSGNTLSKEEIKLVKTKLTTLKKQAKEEYGLKGKSQEDWARRRLTDVEREGLESTTFGKRATSASASDARANTFERLLANKNGKMEMKPKLEQMKLDTWFDSSDEEVGVGDDDDDVEVIEVDQVEDVKPKKARMG